MCISTIIFERSYNMNNMINTVCTQRVHTHRQTVLYKNRIPTKLELEQTKFAQMMAEMEMKMYGTTSQMQAMYPHKTNRTVSPILQQKEFR